jgi:chemotaxis signal transduction protein
MHCLTFTRDTQRYCLPMQFVSEVMPDTALLRFPRMPECFDGLFQLRGRPVTVFNLLKAMNATDPFEFSQIIVFTSPWDHLSIRVPAPVETTTIGSFEITGTFRFGEMISEEEQQYHLLSVDKMISFSKDIVLKESSLFAGAK